MDTAEGNGAGGWAGGGVIWANGGVRRSDEGVVWNAAGGLTARGR